MEQSRTMVYRLSFILFLSLSLIILSGCLNTSPDDQELPWSRPADWETTIPGFGG